MVVGGCRAGDQLCGLTSASVAGFPLVNDLIVKYDLKLNYEISETRQQIASLRALRGFSCKSQTAACMHFCFNIAARGGSTRHQRGGNGVKKLLPVSKDGSAALIETRTGPRSQSHRWTSIKAMLRAVITVPRNTWRQVSLALLPSGTW